MLVDFVDVDSPNGRNMRQSPVASVLAVPEEASVAGFERAVAARSESHFLSLRMKRPVQKMAPECADTVVSMSNGVDTEYFAPDPVRASPFAGLPCSQSRYLCVYRRHGLLAEH